MGQGQGIPSQAARAFASSEAQNRGRAEGEMGEVQGAEEVEVVLPSLSNRNSVLSTNRRLSCAPLCLEPRLWDGSSSLRPSADC
jgi:hypothetical protein